MQLFGKALRDLSVADLILLVESGRAEDQHLEYKRELPGGKDADKREFLADVSAFANTDGGTLVYGIDESDGQPISLCGVGRPAAEEDCLRLQDLIRSGIEPRVSGFAVHRFSLDDGHGVVVVGIPRSWNAPHRVVATGINRFYTRQGAQKFEMSIDQLRTAFGLLGSERDRLTVFRSERLRLIRENQVPLALAGDSRLVLHVLPLSSASAPRRFDLSDLVAMRGLIRPPRGGSYNHRYNIDGFVAYDAGGDGCYSYSQAFHTGAVEIVNSWLLRPRPATSEQPRRRHIGTPAIEQAVFDGYEMATSFQRAVEVDGPIAVMLSLLEVAGFQLNGASRDFYDISEPIDRPELLLSDLVVSEPGGLGAKNVLRPLLDELWNAFGQPRCLQYDSNGDWIA